jgi:oxygen-independent coproporphyrinogen III oxidase
MPGVYLSYPFCSQKCTYCNFASDVFTKGQQVRYESAIKSEIKAHDWSWQPDTLYLGGGTPSLMDASSLSAMLELISAESLVESTMECAPGTLTLDRVMSWRNLGINRVSLGVQSFVQDELRRTGRRHTAQTVESDIRVLATVGIDNINIDLITGLPGQTIASWRESLAWIRRLSPPHVSVYIFEVDEDSNLGREATLGGVRYGAGLLPSDDAVAAMYEMAVVELSKLGIERYEISNFAKPGFESRHNLKYWLREPYVGFGLDAHSFDGEIRHGNVDDLSEYLDRLENDRSPAGHTSTPDAEEEHFFVGLRLAQGIRPTPSEWLRFREPIEQSIRSGLLERNGDFLRLALRGFLVSNEVFENFIQVGVAQ